MSRRSPQRPRDMNQLAHRIVQESVGEAEKVAAPERTPGRRAGGLKGGPARAGKLSPAERSAIARKAAEARWQQPAEMYLRKRSESEDDD